MPPGKRADGPSSGSVAQSLSPLYQDQLYHDPAPGALSLTLSASLSRAEDEELTSLSWLHESTDLLTSLGHSGLRSVSPLQDAQGYCESSSPSPSNSPKAGMNSTTQGRKPPYSFSCLIFMAIENAPAKRLPVKDIYGWILEHFPYFASAPTGWKNSVRHNLSLNKCFKKVDKDHNQNIGKGSLWSVDPEYRHNLIQALKKTPYQPYSPQLSSRCSPQQYHSRPLWTGSPLFRKNGEVVLQVPQKVVQHSTVGLLPVIRPLPIIPVGRSTAARSILGDYLAQGKGTDPSDDFQECSSSSSSPLTVHPFCSQGQEVISRFTQVKSQEVISRFTQVKSQEVISRVTQVNDQEVIKRVKQVSGQEVIKRVKQEPRDLSLSATTPHYIRKTNCIREHLLKPCGTLPLKKRRAEKRLFSEDEEMKEAAGSLLYFAGLRACQNKTNQNISRVQKEQKEAEKD